MIDIVQQLNAIHREVGKRTLAQGESVGVLLRRTYDTQIEDVWSALTERDRIARWFLPVSGDLRVGGKFQLKGNAGGDILHCEPPRLLRVTFGGPTSIVELRLAARGKGNTVLELEHTVPIEIARSGAGSIYVGPGWDGAILALDLFLRGQISADPSAAASSPEGQEFSRQSVHAWASVAQASKTATAEEIAAATQVALSQFAPEGRAP
jgi:uncharacterized protein YndB with AHSA1/START domain